MLPMPYNYLKRSSRQSGFTLTEAAIVLGAIGLLMAAIWSTAGAVSRQQKVNRLFSNIATTFENVKAFTKLGNAAEPDALLYDAAGTASRITAGMYPENFIINKPIPRMGVSYQTANEEIGFEDTVFTPNGQYHIPISYMLHLKGGQLDMATCTSLIIKLSYIPNLMLIGGIAKAYGKYAYQTMDNSFPREIPSPLTPSQAAAACDNANTGFSWYEVKVGILLSGNPQP